MPIRKWTYSNLQLLPVSKKNILLQGILLFHSFHQKSFFPQLTVFRS